MATDYALIRNQIERKKAQIKNFQGDKNLPEKERSFKPEEYDQKIADLQADITKLEKELEK